MCELLLGEASTLVIFILALALFLGRAVIGDFPMFDSAYCDLTRTLLSFNN